MCVCVGICGMLAKALVCVFIGRVCVCVCVGICGMLAKALVFIGRVCVCGGGSSSPKPPWSPNQFLLHVCVCVCVLLLSQPYLVSYTQLTHEQPRMLEVFNS